MSEEKEELLEITGEIKLRRVYDYKPYTYNRIKRILDELGIEMIHLNQGYKANRRPGFCERYDLVECATGKRIANAVSLETCRRVLAKFDFPEKDEKSAGHTTHEWRRIAFNQKLAELREKEKEKHEQR